MHIATVGADGKITLTVSAIAILVAIIGIVPGLVTAGIEAFVKPRAQASAIAVETAKTELERRNAAIALYQSALANPEPAQRQLLLRFLVNVRVLDDDGTIMGMPVDQIPHWPAPAGAP